MFYFQFILVSILLGSISPTTAHPGSIRNDTISVGGDAEELSSRGILHLGDEADLWCDRVMFKDTFASSDCRDGPLYYMGSTKPKVTKTTKLKVDGNMHLARSGSAPGIGLKACDQLLPPSFVLERLRKSGACRLAANQVTNGRNFILRALAVVERDGNRELLQRERLLEMKRAFVSSDPGSKMLKSWSKLDMLGVMHYIVQFSRDSLAIAKAVDAEIQYNFHVQSNVEAEWSRVISRIIRARKLLAAEVQREIDRAAGCSQTPGASGSGGSSGSTGRKLVARYTSLFGDDSTGTSAWPKSSLDKRVGRTPRSGPKAPAAPCCPNKNQPQKKVIPRSNVKTKPQPATKPRQPAAHPKPKAANPKKQVVPRPATRARREPGKQAPRKRATPKQKPRVVPKPTRKPKGKPRTRRRGRK